MSSRPGRPIKNQPLYVVNDWIEYTSDSDTDYLNVQENRSYELIPDDEKWPEASNLPPPPTAPIQYVDEQEQYVDAQEEIYVDEQETQYVDDQHVEQQQEQYVDDQPVDAHHFEEQQDQYVDEQEDQYVEQHVDDQHVDEQEPVVDEQEPVDEQEQQQEEDHDEQHMDDSEPELNMDENYDQIYEQLRSEWLLSEVNHRVSKTATDTFWRIGLKYFHKLHAALGHKRTCQFKTIRRKIYDDKLPDVLLEIGYKNKTTGEVNVVNEKVTPIKQFSPTQYEKLFEIGSIKVS